MKTTWPFETPAAEVIAENGELPHRLRKRRSIPLGPHLAEVLAKAKKRWRVKTAIAHVERGGEDLFALIRLPETVSASGVSACLGLAKSLNHAKSYTRYYACGENAGGEGFVFDRIAANRIVTGDATEIVDPISAALGWFAARVAELPGIVGELGAASLTANKRGRLLFEAVEQRVLAPSRMYAVSQDYRNGGGASAWDLIQAFGRVTNAKAAPSDQFDNLLGFFRLVHGRMAEKAA